jgi:hypothetical protein
MARWLAAAAMLHALLMSAQVLAADMDVRPYLSHRYRDVRPSRPDVDFGRHAAPVKPQPRNEAPGTPAQRAPDPREVKPVLQHQPDGARREVVEPTRPPGDQTVNSELYSLIRMLLGFGLLGLVLAVLDRIHDIVERSRSKS